MFRTIKPDNAYCLYFPNRKEGRRFVAGQSVRVWRWEEWKHVRLGQFSVYLPDRDDDQELITTAENLEVSVRADFKIVVGGREEGREERLKRATLSCPPTRSTKEKIELVFFRDWAKNYCKNSIKRIIGDCAYLSLIEDPDYRADASRRIKEDLANNLEGIGLILVESTTIIEPSEPRGTAATEKVLNKWLEFRKTLDEAELARLRAENETSIARQKAEDERAKLEEQLENQRKIRQLQLASDLREQERQVEIKERKEIRNKEDSLRKYEEELNEWAKDAQLLKIRTDATIQEEKEREKERLEQIRRANEEQALQHRLEMEKNELQHKLAIEEQQKKRRLEILEYEKTASQRELETMELRKQTAVLEAERKRVIGEVEADIMQQKTMAKSADIIKMREISLEALPKIAREVNRPIEKMGEIRVNFIGSPDHADQNGFLNGLLASMSTLPLIKEVLRFLKDFEYEGKIAQMEEVEDKDTLAFDLEGDSALAESDLALASERDTFQPEAPLVEESSELKSSNDLLHPSSQGEVTRQED